MQEQAIDSRQAQFSRGHVALQYYCHFILEIRVSGARTLKVNGNLHKPLEICECNGLFEVTGLVQ